ncbi:SDR family NAD(P)-dependent oxidoreductase [Sphingomonas sp. AOB5]|uniref:SDR family NAD(P)-dependent oxidoreductase n=1 Tax=Sphingomonas sp. AOB5 TaxID=3034017 RepID=UPI0023F8589D|nr:SDR family oxidoreductase [Sphingomonas sp. AOB5]MDF7776081.1 SDR family NAD(P)-dependent oxidoreductase [Sphingomonas sp. AOB5]
MTLSNRLEGKVAIVTGTGNGIGKGVALMFARHGARVIGCDIDHAAAEATLAEARNEGLSFHSLHPCDLTTPDGAQALADFAVEKAGRIDVLVNAAAFGVFKLIEEMSFDDWKRTLSGELDLVFLLTKAVWPHLIAAGGGSIINFASANAYQALPGSGALAHCAGKGGVLALTRQLAMEGGPHGIRANSISPGMIVTAATAPVVADPAMRETILAKKMIKRLGQPEDVAWLATFLASDESAWITGSDHHIDGGATAW